MGMGECREQGEQGEGRLRVELVSLHPVSLSLDMSYVCYFHSHYHLSLPFTIYSFYFLSCLSQPCFPFSSLSRLLSVFLLHFVSYILSSYLVFLSYFLSFVFLILYHILLYFLSVFLKYFFSVFPFTFFHIFILITTSLFPFYFLL